MLNLAMDLLPKIGGVDPYHGGSQQHRPGTGSFARKKKDEEERKQRGEDAPTAAPEGVDPLLAEIDRLRALDPVLTESGAHRALMALRAYQKSPGEVAPDDDDPFAGVPEAPGASSVADHITSRGFTRRPPTPPAPPTGSDAVKP